MIKTNQVRQGDVWVESKELPSTARKQPKNGKIVIANGEVTGHQHMISNSEDVEYFVDTNGDIYVQSEKPITLTHDEHGPITLDPGCYNVSRQREYDVFAERQERQVLD